MTREHTLGAKAQSLCELGKAKAKALAYLEATTNPAWPN